MQGNVALRLFGLRRAVFSKRPAFGDGDFLFHPEQVAPAQRQQLGRTECGGSAGEHQNAMERVWKALDDFQSLLRSDENRFVRGG
jgi:hypothetical protein